MKNVNDSICRQDRVLNETRALALLREAEYGVLSMVDEDGHGYGIPVNFVWDGQENIYLHCAPEGKKLRAIAAHPDVSLTVVGQVHLLPGMFTTEYESVICFGQATVVTDEEVKTRGLRLLVDKLSADYREQGDHYIQKSFHRVAVIRISVTAFSAKSKALHGKKPAYL